MSDVTAPELAPHQPRAATADHPLARVLLTIAGAFFRALFRLRPLMLLHPFLLHLRLLFALLPHLLLLFALLLNLLLSLLLFYAGRGQRGNQ